MTKYHQSALRGFMEPTARATFHEAIYGISQLEQDRVESYAFDFCDDDDNDDDDQDEEVGDINETFSRRRLSTSGPSTTSHGVIKRSKYKSRSEVEAGSKDNPLDLTTGEEEEEEDNDQHEPTEPNTLFKISPRRNPRRSIRITSAVSDKDAPDHFEQADESLSSTSPSDLQLTRNAQAFRAEKCRQHRLSGSMRFDLVRKQRQQIREITHVSCAKARKVKMSAQREVAVAQACLVDDLDEALLRSREPCVLVFASEAPGEYVDFTSLQDTAKELPKSRAAKPALSSRDLLPIENWKGEDLALFLGKAYVFIVVEE